MFVVPGIVAMLAFVWIHPQEVFESLRAVTFPMLLVVGMFGLVLDVRAGATPLRRPSLLLWLSIAFFSWAILTIAITAPDSLAENLNFLAVTIGLFLVVLLGLSTLRGFRIVTVTWLSVTTLLAVIAVHQGFQPPVCALEDNATPIEGESAVGHPCLVRADCVDPDGMGRDYICEHPGLMNTTSIGGRVRYRGIFQDPNELAWALSMALPFVFVWYERRGARGGSRIPDQIVVALVLVAFGICNVLTQSRSGQISLMATVGVYFIRRFGWRGIAFGAVLAAPILLLGGRSDESSTNERLECWAEAFELWREHPLIGVGARQFGQHHFLTAHNSVLLALAELGPIGLGLFTAVIYAAFKITLQVQRDLADDPQAAEARSIAFATLAALVGMVASALFLSLAYHVALWMLIGLTGAIQATVMRHHPDWRLRWNWRDTALVIGIDVALVGGIAAYLKLKGVT
jgi:hypothetical protein